jgi:hypothetical protein
MLKVAIFIGGSVIIDQMYQQVPCPGYRSHRPQCAEEEVRVRRRLIGARLLLTQGWQQGAFSFAAWR